MSERSPTRAAVLELQDERHAMREGYVFLDEKCLLLAGEMLRQLGHHATLERTLLDANERALDALQAALRRHGLQGLQVQPGVELGAAGTPSLEREPGSLMGVPLQQARWSAQPPLGTAAVADAVAPSPEARACRDAFADLLAAAAPLAAVGGNLQRLSQEYRRSVRRARALQDVLLPELEHDLRELEAGLEELEHQDMISMRRTPQGQAAQKAPSARATRPAPSGPAAGAA